MNTTTLHQLVGRLEAGRRVIEPPSDNLINVGLQGFGADPVASPQPDIPPQAHFVWPCDERTFWRAVAFDELTPEREGEIYDAALEDIEAAANGSSAIYWRRRPEWQTERFHESDAVCHMLLMRGTFVWDQ